MIAWIGISSNQPISIRFHLAWYSGLHQQTINLNCAAQTYLCKHGRATPPFSLLSCKVLNFTLGFLPCHMNLDNSLSHSEKCFLGKETIKDWNRKSNLRRMFGLTESMPDLMLKNGRRFHHAMSSLFFFINRAIIKHFQIVHILGDIYS